QERRLAIRVEQPWRGVELEELLPVGTGDRVNETELLVCRLQTESLQGQRPEVNCLSRLVHRLIRRQMGEIDRCGQGQPFANLALFTSLTLGDNLQRKLAVGLERQVLRQAELVDAV